MDKQLEVGQIIGRTFGLVFAGFGTYVGIGLLLLSPVIVLEAYMAFGAGASTGNLLLTFVSPLLQGLLGQVVTASVMFGVFEQLNGRQPRLGACMGVGLRRLVPVIVISILSGLAVLIGFLMLIVPGIIMATLLYVSVPATVVERTGIIESLERSEKLTKGQRVRIFLLMLFLGLLNIILAMVAGLLTVAFPTTGQIFTIIVGVFIIVLQATMAALVYLRLREMKEDLGIDKIADVFK